MSNIAVSKKKSNTNNMIKKKMIIKEKDILQFEEEISIENAKYILGLGKEDFFSEVFDIKEKSQQGKEYNKDWYFKMVKDLCRRVIKTDGKDIKNYKYSQKLSEHNKGRIYVKGFGVQSLQKRLRGFLCKDYYHDVDIINAHPSLLLYLCNKHYPNLEVATLKKYVNGRDKLLTKYNTDKFNVLVNLNIDKPFTTNNKLISALNNDFMKIKDKFYNDEKSEYQQYINKKKLEEDSKNPKSSFLNRILCILENDILQSVIHKLNKTENYKDKIGVPYYDGFFIKNDIGDIKELLKIVNEITNKYNIKWINKEHDTSISIDTDLIDDTAIIDDRIKDYDYVKEKFEINNFLIECPINFIHKYKNCKGKDAYMIYNKGDFNTLHGALKYEEIFAKKDKEGNILSKEIIKKDFYDKWLKDEDRKTYKSIDFIPTENTETISPRIFNTFQSFSNTTNDKELYLKYENEVKLFLNHLKLLVNNEKESYKYLVNYIADIIQNPNTNPNICLLFKSKKGLGKDLMINYIERILGYDYVYRTSKLDEIFGNFNPALKDRLIIQLNEVEGKEGFSNKEKIKDHITAERLNINEKNIKQYTINNYIRWFIFSNNKNPIEITGDTRRFVVFKGANLIDPKLRKKYYDPLWDNLKDENVIKALYYYLKYEINLDNVSLRNDRPITNEYKTMQSNSINPIHLCLHKLLNDNYYKNNIMHYELKNGYILIKTTELHSYYKSWAEKSNFVSTLNFKQIKPLLEDLNIISKRKLIKGNRGEYYTINPVEVLKTLVNDIKINNEDDCEEIDENDLVDNGFLEDDSSSPLDEI